MKLIYIFKWNTKWNTKIKEQKYLKNKNLKKDKFNWTNLKKKG